LNDGLSSVKNWTRNAPENLKPVAEQPRLILDKNRVTQLRNIGPRNGGGVALSLLSFE